MIDTKDGKFGFVEVRSRVHKTGGTEEKKALFMPFIAPVAGVTTKALGYGLERGDGESLILPVA